ncbi:PREDICTED: uncharacterized protein LOC104815224 [Tarenaya hassleriana]|uniref:uncharacterized protein LOC104811406 n=1 Tax=Tarenaya hassleriana TaxID=28532 RepID=UPI00053C8437|nr:PREDICTED: uncharacterized protein LOC104811406 [Tarenaya hassleriana]XP_010541846.1 PREDICTED: uncharacterized protein LOC104815224 [Tarenaya hassleriana]
MSKFVATLLVVLVSLDAATVFAYPPLFRRFNIELKNGLQSNKAMKVHCRAKGEDFPYHIIDIGGIYQLKFTVYVNTLYWCNIWQGPNYQHHAKFNAFIAVDEFINDTCGGRKPNVCRFEAREDGVYARNNAKGESEYKFLYKWDS